MLIAGWLSERRYGHKASKWKRWIEQVRCAWFSVTLAWKHLRSFTYFYDNSITSTLNLQKIYCNFKITISEMFEIKTYLNLIFTKRSTYIVMCYSVTDHVDQLFIGSHWSLSLLGTSTRVQNWTDIRFKIYPKVPALWSLQMSHC